MKWVGQVTTKLGTVTNQKGHNKITKRKVVGYLTLKKMMISKKCWTKKLIARVKMNIKRVEIKYAHKQRLPYQVVSQTSVFANNVNMKFPQQKKNIMMQFRRKHYHYCTHNIQYTSRMWIWIWTWKFNWIHWIHSQ